MQLKNSARITPSAARLASSACSRSASARDRRLQDAAKLLKAGQHKRRARAREQGARRQAARRAGALPEGPDPHRAEATRNEAIKVFTGLTAGLPRAARAVQQPRRALRRRRASTTRRASRSSRRSARIRATPPRTRTSATSTPSWRARPTTRRCSSTSRTPARRTSSSLVREIVARGRGRRWPRVAKRAARKRAGEAEPAKPPVGQSPPKAGARSRPPAKPAPAESRRLPDRRVPKCSRRSTAGPRRGPSGT